MAGPFLLSLHVDEAGRAGAAPVRTSVHKGHVQSVKGGVEEARVPLCFRLSPREVLALASGSHVL